MVKRTPGIGPTPMPQHQLLGHAAKLLQHHGVAITPATAEMVLMRMVEDEARKQLPRIVFGRESRLWSCIGPGDSLAYGTSPKDAYNNWRTMHGSALEGSTG